MMDILKKFCIWNLNREQDSINKEYEENGLTDEVLKRQVEVNKSRNELDIPDFSELNDEGFAQ